MDISQLSGQFLGQYELRELLGRGGMGAVYRGYQRTLQREVAIKIILPSLTSETDYLERFRREAHLVARLEHTHIVPVYDYGTHEDINFIVMRLLQGGSLAQRLDTQPFLSLLEISSLLDQLARALDHAHSKGVIHRDIKTNNVMYDEHQNAYLVDFGIAKPLHSASANDLTPTDVLIGTPGYMAPELWRDGVASKATDLYALGILVYVTLTGKLPFESPLPMFKHLHEEPPPLQESRSDLPDDLQSVMSKALAKDPELRYQSAKAFARAFKRIANRSRGSNRSKHPSSAIAADTTIPPANSNTTLPLTQHSLVGASSSAGFIRLKQLKLIAILFIVIVTFGIFPSVVNLIYAAISSTPTPTFMPSVTPIGTSRSMIASTQRVTTNYTSVPTRSVTASPIPSNTNTPTATPTSSMTPSATRTNTATHTPSRTPSPTRTATPTQTATATPSHTATLTLTSTTSPTATETTIPEITNFSGSLTASQLNAEHFFAWKGGDIVSIAVTTDGFDSVINLVRSNGDVVADDDDCHSNMQASCIEFIQLPADDTYILTIDSWNMASVGNYSGEIKYIHHCSDDEPFAIVRSSNTSINLRRGSSTSHPVIGLVPNQACVAIIGRNPSTTWLKIRTESMRTGWISGDIVHVFGDMETVPIVEG